MFPRSMAKKPMAYSKVAPLATLKDREENNVRSSTGSAWREERYKKQQPRTVAVAKQMMMRPLDQPQLGPSDTPSTKEARVPLMRSTPG
jgi:hypothetical protein